MVSRLIAKRGPGESYSDAILRLGRQRQLETRCRAALRASLAGLQAAYGWAGRPSLMARKIRKLARSGRLGEAPV